jgi:hypothetical protein
LSFSVCSDDKRKERVMDDGTNVLLVLLVFAGWFAMVGIPVMKILNKAGFSRGWALLAFIPLLSIIGLWVFAFARWPTRVAVADVFD